MKKIIMGIIVLLMVVPNPVMAADVTNKSNIPYSTGKKISGDCLSKEVTLNDSLKGMMVASDDGLELLDQDFKVNITNKVKSFEVIGDIDSDGFNDIAVELAVNAGYHNFQVISSKSGEVLYESQLTHQLGDGDGNPIAKNVGIQQMLGSDKFVYVVYDYHLIKLDVKNKKVIFDYEDDDNIWKMVLVEDKVFFIDQLGQLVNLDNDGSVIYKRQITKAIAVKNENDNKNVKIKLNLWDILVIENNLYITGEDDNLYVVDRESGEVINTVDLGVTSDEDIVKRIKKQNFYNQSSGKMEILATGTFSSAYEGYKIKQVQDGTLLVEAYLGDHNYQPTEVVNNDDKKNAASLLLIDLNSSTVTGKIDLEQYNLNSSNAVLSTYQGESALVVPVSSKGGVLRVFAYGLDGSLKAQSDVKNTGVPNEKVKVALTNYGTDYLLSINDGNGLVLNNDLKSLRYLGNSVIVNQIASVADGILVSNNHDGKITGISKLGNGGKDDVLMNVALNVNYPNNGFEAINYDASSNQILALVNETSNNNVVASHLMMLNLNDGSLNWDKKVLLEKGTDENNKYFEHYLVGEKISYFKDLNSDGKKEILVDGRIIDGSSFEFKGTDNKAVEDGTIIEAGDLNKDGLADLVSVGESEMRVYYAKTNGYEVTYEKSNLVKKYDKSLLNNQTVKVLGDLDHQGINLFVINARNEAGCQYYQVINPGDLSVRFNLMDEGVFDWGESFSLSGYDYNHDGTDDLIFNDYNRQRHLLNGKDGKTLMEIKSEDSEINENTSTAMDNIVTINLDTENISVFTLEDITGDGIKEIGYLSFEYSNSVKCYLKVVDGNSYEEVKKCSLDGLENEDNKVISVVGQTKIICSTPSFYQIYDYQKEQLIAGCDIKAVKAQGLNDGRIMMEDATGELYSFDDSCDFSLLNLKETHLNNGKIVVKYQSDKLGMLSVYDGTNKIGQSVQKEVSISLANGKHRLIFSYDDGHGKVTHITKDVVVEKSNVMRYLLCFGFLILLLGALLNVFYPKYHLYQKAGIKNGKVD